MFLALLLALQLALSEGRQARVEGDPPVTITVVDKGSGRPVFARLVLKNSKGEIVDGTGYRTLTGHVVPPDGWKVALAKGTYTVHVDAGFEFFALDETWTFDGAAEKKVELARWIDLRKEGWYGGGDHNHLNREGTADKNYGKTQVTMEFAAALLASRGWSYYSAGGGGPWVVDGSPPMHQGGRTAAAADAWNRKYGAHLRLGWNNEAIKGRFGHVWTLGADMKGLTYPYTDKTGDAWWSFYDDSWDPWQTGDRTKPLGPYKSGTWENPPVFDCIRSWRDRGILSIYAHPTRTFMIGKNRVSNIAAELAFDLLAGAPVGGLAVMGDVPDHADDQALWFAALNEGYRLPGFAENDMVFGAPDPRIGPHVTYANVPDMGATVDLAKIVQALGAGRSFMSSGAFCIATADKDGLAIRAWASADPNDAIDRLEVIANGKVVMDPAEPRGGRTWNGRIPVVGAKWAVVKVICKNRGAVAITNPVYFTESAPEPVQATVTGKITRDGKGVPATVTVFAWGKEVSRSAAAADGSYRLGAVPLASHLIFAHEGKSAEKVILWDDPEYRAIHFAIYSTSHLGQPGTLAGCLPADLFAKLRARAKGVVIDADLPK